MNIKDNRGEFWIDDRSTAKTGSITISDNHLVNINVNGAIFTGNLTSLIMSHDVINGYLYSGEYIKILNPYSFRGIGIKEENCHEKYSGSVYATSKSEIPNNPNFNKIRWALDGLENWLNIKSYSIVESSKKRFSVDFVLPEEVASWETRIGIIRLHSNYPIETGLSYFNIKNSFYLELEFTEEKCLQECLAVAQSVERFFITFVNKNNLLTVPSLINKDNNEIHLFYQTYKYEKGYDTKYYASSFESIRDNFGSYLSNYIELSPDYLAGFFGYPASFSKGLFIENRFLHLVTGLEALHTNKYGRYKESEDRDSDIKNFTTKLLDCTKFNSSERRSIIHCFKENYKYELRERLVELVREFDFLDYNAGKSIMKDISVIRNELVHSGSLKKGSMFTTGTIVKLNYILEMLSVLTIMLVCGVDKETLWSIYSRSQFYVYPKTVYKNYCDKR